MIRRSSVLCFLGLGLLAVSRLANAAPPIAPTAPGGKVDVSEVRALDYRGALIDPATSHASFSRTLPPELGGAPEEQRDTLSFLLIAAGGGDVSGLQLVAKSVTGEPLDSLPRLAAEVAACPAGVAPSRVCFRTPALRVVGDALERSHPALQARSLRAQLGGTLSLSLAGRKLLELKVGGPRETRLGPIERLRAKLRVLVLRTGPKRQPVLGGSDALARRLMENEVESAATLWAQCGIELGVPGRPSIEIVDPPSSQLLAIGCGLGQPASGGKLRLRSGGKRVELQTTPGESPISVALRLADALLEGGKAPEVFQNERASNASAASADVLLHRRAKLTRDGTAPFSSDPSLPVCLGQLDLSDGLNHFGNGDAFSGTLEERTLLRGLDDGDPLTVEVLVVPAFDRSERIGESFISTSGSSLPNAVIIDRSAIVAGARSFVLAHELGHVLLAMPGHPDDFGVDKSHSLMDADVADPTIFGPRRLSVADCERAVIQTGPNSLMPLLQSVPLH